jgi:sugar O-acyltransferase (sialic acid O-acetyltransferase NeuD family)
MGVMQTTKAEAVPILLLGSGGFAEEVADLVGDCPGYEVVGFVESLDRARCSMSLGGLPVHWVDDIAGFAGSHLALSAVGTTERDAFTSRVAALGLGFATIVHPTAHVSSSALLDEGVLVGAGAIVAAHSHVGPHALLNRGVLVGHHAEIDAHASVMPGANLAGSCSIGERAFVGMGALVLNNVRVGRLAVVGAGSVVTRDVPDGVQVRGVPARVVELSSVR